MSCPFKFVIAEEEVESLHWLQRTLSQIALNPKHRNYDHALRCIGTINRMNDYIFDAHFYLHDMERDMEELAERAGVEEIKYVTKEISGKYGPN